MNAELRELRNQLKQLPRRRPGSRRRFPGEIRAAVVAYLASPDARSTSLAKLSRILDISDATLSRICSEVMTVTGTGDLASGTSVLVPVTTTGPRSASKSRGRATAMTPIDREARIFMWFSEIRETHTVGEVCC